MTEVSRRIATGTARRDALHVVGSTVIDAGANAIDVAAEAACPVAGDLRNSDFARGAPTYAGFTTQHIATTIVADGESADDSGAAWCWP